MWRGAILAVAMTTMLPACAVARRDAPTPIEDIEYQWGAEPDDAAWKPTKTSVTIARHGDERVVWCRVRAPSIDAPDPAIRISRTSDVVDLRVGGRPIDRQGSTLIVPVVRDDVLILGLRPPSDANLPSFTAGSQRALWIRALERELPELVIAGTLILAGAILLVSTLRRGAARAYRGLGLFVGSLGVVTFTQLSMLRTILFPSFTFVFNIHEAASLLFPIGFADFTIALFGDGRHKVLSRGLALYAVYVPIAIGLYFTTGVDEELIRSPINIFQLVFTAQALLLAVRRARAGDAAARAFLGGVGTLVLVATPDIVSGIGFVSIEFQTVPYGILAFGVAMAIVTERRLADTRDALAVSAIELGKKVEALEDRNREVGTLNTELRHQVAERSKQLAAALTAGVALPRAAQSLDEGEILDDRYRVIRALGRGGMGSVHEVARIRDDRRFALKVMSGDPTATDAARFAREAEIAARITDPNIVAVTDVGGAASGRLYLVMELVTGSSLSGARDRFGDVRWSLGVLAQIARGLATLHDAGVVHRDLKPGNVLLARGDDGREIAKISDFGISRFGAAGDDESPSQPLLALPADLEITASPAAETADLWARDKPSAEITTAPPSKRARATSALTETGALMGTPAYMAPELAASARRAKPSSDVFALGLLAYEMLAARPAFPAPPVILMLTDGELPSPDPMPSEVPSEAMAMVLRCLSVSPEQRPSAREAAEVLARCAVDAA